MLLGTLPSTKRRAPVIPLLPTTIRSASVSSATLRIASVGPPSTGWVCTSSPSFLAEAAAASAKKEGLEVQTHPVEGGPTDAILNVAEETDADLIVVGNKGMTGARRFVLGSVPNNISHHAPCSVMIVRTT